MSTERDGQMIELQRSTLLAGPDWDAVVAAVCAEADFDQAVKRLLAA